MKFTVYPGKEDCLGNVSWYRVATGRTWFAGRAYYDNARIVIGNRARAQAIADQFNGQQAVQTAHLCNALAGVTL